MKILMVVYDNDSYTTHFPMGLAYLSSAARNAGHQVSVYQQDIFHWPDEHLTNWLDEHDYDVVEVSVIGGYYQYKKLLNLSKAINASKNRGKFKYTIGGHGPAADPNYFLHKTGADVVGIGEGEITFVELMDAFLGKRSLESVNGIAFLDERGKYVRTAPRQLIQNIDTADFYENKHINSDLIAVNFTEYSDYEIHMKLYEANMRLIRRYLEVQADGYEKTCKDLYYKKNAAFRGFRQT